MQILPFESDSMVLEGNGGILSEERILQFIKQCTGVHVVSLHSLSIDHTSTEQLFRLVFYPPFLRNRHCIRL